MLFFNGIVNQNSRIVFAVHIFINVISPILLDNFDIETIVVLIRHTLRLLIFNPRGILKVGKLKTGKSLRYHTTRFLLTTNFLSLNNKGNLTNCQAQIGMKTS